jgi:hypothetical protein
MKNFFNRNKKSAKKPVEKSELMQYIETNSTVPPTGKVVVVSNGKKRKFDYFAGVPTPEILKLFVDGLKKDEDLKLKNVTEFWYE